MHAQVLSSDSDSDGDSNNEDDVALRAVIKARVATQRATTMRGGDGPSWATTPEQRKTRRDIDALTLALLPLQVCHRYTHAVSF